MSLTDLAPVSSSTSNTIRRSVTFSGAGRSCRAAGTRQRRTSALRIRSARIQASPPEKSLIGNTDLNTACKPSRPPPAFRLVHLQELIIGLLLHLDEVGHLGHFLDVAKNFRIRLRPLNVCAMIVPSHFWALSEPGMPREQFNQARAAACRAALCCIPRPGSTATGLRGKPPERLT
jgi:hypothetical protein